MACTCRTAALRLFVRGFAQLQIAERAPASATLRHNARPPKPHPLSTYRSLHSSSKYREAATPSETPAPAPSASAESKPDQGAQEGHEEPKEQRPAAYSAVADLTPEAIDSLASEIASGTFSKSAYPTHDSQPVSEPEDAYYDEAQTVTSGRLKRAKELAKKKKAGDKATEEQEAEAEAARQKERAAKREPWQAHKAALKAKLGGEAWNPRKRLSPDALAGIRALHDEFPEVYTTGVLAAKFEISPEAVRRILKSRWAAKPEEDEDRERRWLERGKKIWKRNAELGMKPPKVWRELGIKRVRRDKHTRRNDVGWLESPYRAKIKRKPQKDDDDDDLDF